MLTPILQAWVDDYSHEENYQMAIKTTNSGGDFEKAPEGMRMGRCYKIVDCGTHMNPLYGKEQRLAWVYFELPSTLMTRGEQAGKPFIIGKRYGLSHNEKAILRLDLESWYGKKFDTKALDQAGGFDLEKLIGRPALLNIVHSDDGKYANIKTVNPLADGMDCPAAVNKPFVFSLAEFDSEKFSQLSEKMQEFISQSKEYKEMLSGGHKDPVRELAEMEDDIPF